MTTLPDFPHRREVWLVSLGAGRSGEPGKTRPAVVVSSDHLNAGVSEQLIVVVPLSSSRAPSDLRIEIPADVGLDQPSRAICRAVRSVVSSRLVHRIGRVDAETMGHIETALSLILELRPTATG